MRMRERMTASLHEVISDQLWVREHPDFIDLRSGVADTGDIEIAPTCAGQHDT
jgi:hypothetical protein